MPIAKLNKVKHRSTEKNSIYEKQRLINSLVLSPDDYIANDEFDNITQQCDVSPSSATTTSSSLPTEYQYAEENWKYSNGLWLPPEEPPATINKLQRNESRPSQSDSGANRVVTDDITKLLEVRNIDPVPMSGCNKDDDSAIVCTAIGKLPIQTMSGEILYVTCYYSEEVDGTIISPTAICSQYRDRFYGWMQYANCRNKKGTITLLGDNDEDNEIFEVYSNNDLWFHEPHTIGPVLDCPKLNRLLSNAARYELWHQRTAHSGQKTMEILHNHADGVPKLKGNAFYRCPSCMSGKLATKQPIGVKSKKHQRPVEPTDRPPDEDDKDEMYLPEAQPGQHLHMDFGFVRGSDFNDKTNSGQTVTSIDGKRAYLAIIDRSSRYMWVFITSSKQPPLKEAKMILQKFKSTNPHRTVRVDQGGELNSQAFKEMIGLEGFSLELTGSDASAQNGMVENPNRTYGQIMRCLLHSADLGPEYWSYALAHAVYIKNRLPHHSINCSPYQKFTGKKPNLQNLRIFGSKVYSKKPGKRPYKLDHHTDAGVFLGYTATDKIVNYIDEKTGRVKTATHVIYDEAHFTTPANKAPIAAQTLQRLGYYAKEDWIKEATNEMDAELQEHELQVQRLSGSAIVPTRSTEKSIGYDLHFDGSEPTTIPPGTFQVLSTGIAIKCPTNTYARIAPRSGLTVKNSLTTLAGVIDPDYTGEVKVILHNFGQDDQTIEPQQRIAQIILERASTPSTTIVDSLAQTIRGDKGFGSTELKNNNPSTPFQLSEQTFTHNIIRDRSTTAAAATLHAKSLHTTIEPLTSIQLSHDPYDNHTHRVMDIRSSDKDPCLGLVIEKCPHRDLPQLKDIKSASSATRIKRWRSELRDAYITTVNDIGVTSIEDIMQHIAKARSSNETSIKIGFSTITKQAMHPQLGIPQLYHDQMNIIGTHLHDISNSPEWNLATNEEIAIPMDDTKAANLSTAKHKKCFKTKNKFWSQLKNLPNWYKIAAIKKRKKLTRSYLMKQADWNDWAASERKQLDQYEAQGTLGTPCELPKGANLLPLLWTYMIKDDGTKKARCVCNGSPKMKGSVTLGDTYAGSLEQTGSRIFWAATAINNFVTIGADVSNAFAEAPPPKAPLYVTIDQPYRDWYHNKYPDRPPLTKSKVLPVHGALQGHPESARLWALLIDDIIRTLNLKPCSHEPCLYYTDNFNNTGKKLLFLRQVDDFAISCEDKETALEVIKEIDSKMTVRIKHLGQITRFNGVDVLQAKHYIKLYNKTYINKILQRHDWIHTESHHPHSFPLPMKSDNNYQRQLENQPLPTPEEISALEREMGFGYRQAIGELIYALCTCRPDISYPVIKLSQYSTRPTRIHFEAVKDIYRYLNATKEDGLIFWRKTPRNDLPFHPPPDLKTDNNYSESDIHERQQHLHNILFGAVDSDYAGDTSHRRSVSGIVLRLAGGTILYKSKFQDIHALSSTEAEFTAAVEAGKYILYVRSILEEIGLPQDEATVLFEDNQGALLLANAQQPTKRTRHMDIKNFALQDWVKEDLIRLLRIATNDNYADVMTKATARTLFYRHMNYIMGKIIPSYVQGLQSFTQFSVSKSKLRLRAKTVENTGG